MEGEGGNKRRQKIGKVEEQGGEGEGESKRGEKIGKVKGQGSGGRRE